MSSKGQKPRIQLILPPEFKTEDDFFRFWNSLTPEQRERAKEFIKITRRENK
jgi:hypothetical protein